MENQTIKVCVRIPGNRKEELLQFAEKLRSEDQSAGRRGPGWDSKAIHEIARSKYGGLRQLFEHHEWPERGSDMMRQVQARIKAKYGSVEKFVSDHS